MNLKIQKSAFLILPFVLSSFFSLSGCKPKNEKIHTDTDTSFVLDEKSLQQAAKSIISIPSPIENTILFMMADVKYNEKVLNPVSRISNYSTNDYKAFNLGVYSADLSYLSYFDEAQKLIDYVNASKTLADAIGILEAIDEKTIKLLEDNMGDPDMLMGIISETLLESDAYLKENERAEIAAIVVAGGWIETLYIATQLTEGSQTSNKKLTDIIMSYSLQLDDVISLLDTFKYNNEIAEMQKTLEDLRTYFSQIQETRIEGDTALDTKIERTMSDDTFISICKKVESIRNKYTNI